MGAKVLFITPPFTQLNTPYPATAYLTGFFNTQNVATNQVDLGINVTLQLFSKSGFTAIFDTIQNSEISLSESNQRIVDLATDYIATIDAVIKFLQGKNPTLAHSIVSRDFLPEGERFEQLEDLAWTFGEMGITDKAKRLATLYLEDMADLIVAAIDPHFGFSRYAEKIAVAANSFDELHEALQKENSLIDTLLITELKKAMGTTPPELVAISIPFPGNLYGALKCGQWIKQNFPTVAVTFGGGYPNTELRSLSDVRVFEYVDFITLDDGEAPLTVLLDFLAGKRNEKALKRTLTLHEGKVAYFNGAPEPDVHHSDVGTPDYTGLDLTQYISVIEIANPMHRLWSDGRWNKLTLAHGCYWGKCTFCDTSLDYIKRYQPVGASLLCDRIEQLISQTGENGFHFVDEAAPPALLRDLSLEILRRNLKVTWWTNIRFEQKFTSDLAKLMKLSGCIAISGGLEVASDRLLEKINKGVSIEKVSKVTQSLTDAGIMVHAYLMYGFPTQTEQETVDALEVVRQLFEAGIVQSAYWHRFSMTAHSPIGIYPQEFGVSKTTEEIGAFANNDLFHNDPEGGDHSKFSYGLRKSLLNFMHGMELDTDLQEWFDFNIPKTDISPTRIAGYLTANEFQEINPKQRLIWTGSTQFTTMLIGTDKMEVSIPKKVNTIQFTLPVAQAEWVMEALVKIHVSNTTTTTYKHLEEEFNQSNLGYFLLFWNEEAMNILRKNGLLLL
tara:strand:+ start:91495 stop:93675 length:2181 start_codon:yes stop_codon:yes gene_type:complete